MYGISEELLHKAAQPTRAAILELGTNASKTLKAVLAHICEHFFDPGYTLEELKEAVGVKDKWLVLVFREEIGLTVWSFIRECRLEMAARLLRDTSLSVLDVCLLVGYSSVSHFRHIFRRWSGLRPERYRECARWVLSHAGHLLDDAITWIYRDRCRRGDLTTEELHELIEYLETLYGPVDPSTLYGPVDSPSIRRTLAFSP